MNIPKHNSPGCLVSAVPKLIVSEENGGCGKLNWRLLIATAVVGAATFLTGCGGGSTGSNPTPNALSVAIVSPSSGSSVAGTVPVSASVSGGSASSVQFLLDGAPLGSAQSAVPYSVPWNTSASANGSHLLSARAQDAAGNAATSSGVSVNVNNGAGQSRSLTVAIISPAPNATVSGTVTLSASAISSSAITGVSFQVDGAAVGSELSTTPYVMAWNASTVTDGMHTLTVSAHDASGHVNSMSQKVVVSTSNTCGSGWCNVFPVASYTGQLTPAFGSSAWNKLNYVPDAGRFFIFTSDNIYTFSNSWWSYGVLGSVATTTNPWVEESTSGTNRSSPLTVTDNSKGLLNAAIGPTNTTITLQTGGGSTFHPDPVHGGVLVIDDEEIGYTSANLSGDTISNVTRGIRGTTAASHNAAALVTAGAPFPQSRIGGALVPVNDHIPDRHPFLFSAYNTRRSQLFQATGIVELNKLDDTWYFCMQQNAWCPAQDVRVWKWLHTPTQLAGKADGAMTYDSDDDVIILYGGQIIGSPTPDTWLLCFQADPQISGNNVGCPAGHTYPDWVHVTTTPATGAGPRYYETIVYDSYHHKAVLFGGSDGSATDPNTTWVYTPATRTWTNANPSGNIPSAFRRPAMTYDSKRHLMVLNEGPLGVVTSGIPGGLYVYDVGANTWTLTTVPGGPIPSTPTCCPPAHGRLSMAYDWQTDTFVATELALPYSLQVWELKGSALGIP